MHILFLSRWFPYPANNGSKLRIFNLLTGLAEQHAVTLISFIDQVGQDARQDGLKQFCKEVIAVPWKPFNPQSSRSKMGFFSITPRSFLDTFSEEMAYRIRETVRGSGIDLVIASQVDMASYRPYFDGLPAIFEEVEVGSIYEQARSASSSSKRMRAGLMWMKYRAFLARLIRQYQACTVVSQDEKKLVQDAVLNNAPVEVIPNTIDLKRYSTDVKKRKNELIFCGSFSYQPNYDAMVWFTGEVYDLIRQEIPDVQFTITGETCGKMLPKTDHVILTGLLDDVRSRVAGSSCSIVPIFTGGGTRLKILESMALHTPVVTTTKGAEGLDVSHGFHLLVADDPGKFATEVVRLLRDESYSKYLADNAYNLMVERYDWGKVKTHFLDIVGRVGNS